MTTDNSSDHNSSSSDEPDQVRAPSWPPPEGEAAETEALLHKLLRSAELEKDRPRLADLKAARSLPHPAAFRRVSGFSRLAAPG